MSRSGRGVARGFRTPPPAPAPAALALHRRALELGLTAVALAFVAVVLARLVSQARAGVFATDECFHAYVAEWMLRHRAFPVEFPELYSGFLYYYQPLFHVLGALWSGVFGAASLHVFPVALHGLLLALLATGALGALPRRAGPWAAFLCALSSTLTAYSVRLYVDVLPALLFVLAAALLVRVRAGAGRTAAVALALVAALAPLAKFSGLFVPLALFVTAAVDAARGERRTASRVALAALAGVALAAPWYVRNQLLFGSALYPLGAPDLDHALYVLNRARFSIPAPEFLRALPVIVGPWLGACAVAGLGAAVARRRFALREGILLAAIAGMVATAFVPMAAARHLAPFLALLAFGAAWALDDLVREWRWAPVAAALVMAALMAHAVVTLPGHRRAADLPAHLQEAFPQVAARTPAGARILSLWTYDTFFYTRRAATWPNPWGQRGHPVREFTETDPDRFLAQLHEDGITHVLVPMTSPPGPFDSANYPDSFARMLAAAVMRGAARLEWASGTLALVHVLPADPAAAPR